MAHQQELIFGASNGQKVLGHRLGGCRSDVMLKHDMTLLGHVDNGLGFYRFSCSGGIERYVGVLAQAVQQVMTHAVARARGAYLRIFDGKLGLEFEIYDRWLRFGAPYGINARDRSSRDPCRVTRKLHMHSDLVGTPDHIRAFPQTCIHQGP
jgi:hypothetical protein